SEASGMAAKIIASIVISVSSTLPTMECARNLRPTTSTKVSVIMAKSATAATVPRTARIPASQPGRPASLPAASVVTPARPRGKPIPRRGSGERACVPWLPPGSVLGDQRTVLLEHLRAIGQPALLRLRNPLLLEAGSLGLHLVDELLAGVDDLDVVGLHHREPGPVDAVPCPSDALGKRDAGELLDRVLVLLADLRPGVLVHHDGEAGVVEAAGEGRPVLDQLLQLEAL